MHWPRFCIFGVCVCVFEYVFSFSLRQWQATYALTAVWMMLSTHTRRKKSIFVKVEEWRVQTWKQLYVREVSFVSTAVWSDVYFPLVVDWWHCNFNFLQISHRINLKPFFLLYIWYSIFFLFYRTCKGRQGDRRL